MAWYCLSYLLLPKKPPCNFIIVPNSVVRNLGRVHVGGSLTSNGIIRDYVFGCTELVSGPDWKIQESFTHMSDSSVLLTRCFFKKTCLAWSSCQHGGLPRGDFPSCEGRSYRSLKAWPQKSHITYPTLCG